MIKPLRHSFWEALIREVKIWRVGALPGLLVIALILLARLSGHLQFFELMALDYLLRLRPGEPPDERILIVGIDEEDIRQIGTYPIPDQDLAQLIQALQKHQPGVIGLDIVRDLPVEPGYADLHRLLKTSENLISIERFLPDSSGLTINPPPGLPIEQVGFADIVLDSDSRLRRSLLSATNPENEYQLSLALRLAEIYLLKQGMLLEYSTQQPISIWFGTTEIPRFQPNSGGYVRADAGGLQTLLNFRSGSMPFRRVSMQDVLQGKVPVEWMRDRIVLIGVTAASAKDFVNSAAVDTSQSGLLYGVEMHAHAVSQLISAVLNGRPLLRVWGEGWEYGWIVIWGCLGISLGRFLISPVRILGGLAIASVLLVVLCYGAVLIGWWVPLVPALLGLMVNGAGLTAALFYRYQQDLKTRLEERQRVIDHTFTAIHNGPLQTLAVMLRSTEIRDERYAELERLNRELRTIYESIRQETFTDEYRFYLTNQVELNLRNPLKEVLYEVYSHTLSRDLPNFKAIQATITSFEEIEERYLTLEQKQRLCRFLEEALCNVGKHAAGVTRLEVVCIQEQDQNLIRISDNGAGINASDGSSRSGGWGTKQAHRLARQLGGKFQRSPRSPKGTICELTWPTKRPLFWRGKG